MKFVYIKRFIVIATISMLSALVYFGVIDKPNSLAAGQSCTSNDIARCGIQNYGELTQKYDQNQQGDLRAIYDHYWIKRTLEPGTHVVEGVANNKGEVIAEGRVVAVNAASIGRQPIAHSHPISIAGKTYYETSHVGGQAFAAGTTQLRALVVLDDMGNFKYAILKVCGNPIFAQPFNIKKTVCDKNTKQIVTIRQEDINGAIHSENLDDCKDKVIQVCDVNAKKVITIKESQFNQSTHSTNLNDCEDKPMRVCQLDSKHMVTIKESQFNQSKYSKNPEDCVDKPMNVCDIKAKKVITIKESQYDNSKYSRNFDDCKIKQLEVCDTTTKKIVTVDEKEAKKSKYSTDKDDCKIKKLTVCDLNTKQIVNIKEDEFNKNKSRYSDNVSDCEEKPIQVCDIKAKKITTIDQDKFDESKYSKNLDDCKSKPVEVCKIDTKEIVTVDEEDFKINSAKYSQNLSDCNEKLIQVCDTTGMQVVSIKENDFDGKRYTKNLDNCKPAPELPHTGGLDVFGAGVGISAIGLASYYYAASRQNR